VIPDSLPFVLKDPVKHSDQSSHFNLYADLLPDLPLERLDDLLSEFDSSPRQTPGSLCRLLTALGEEHGGAVKNDTSHSHDGRVWILSFQV